MEAASPSEASVTVTKGCDLTFQKAGMFNSTAVKNVKSRIFFKDATRARTYCLSPIHLVM